MSVIRLSLAFIDCIQAAFKLQVKGLLTWVRKDKKIYIQTYTHFSENNFRKPCFLKVKHLKEKKDTWLTKRQMHEL